MILLKLYHSHHPGFGSFPSRHERPSPAHHLTQLAMAFLTTW